MNQETRITGEAIEPTPLTTRRQALMGGAFLAAAAAGFVLRPRQTQKLLGTAKLDDLVPHSFAGWQFEAASGLVLPPADQLRDKLYSQLLTRVYSRPDGSSVMLLIAYSGAQDGTIQVHRPEFCYPASGFKLTAIEDHRLPIATSAGVPSRYIVAEAAVRREQMVYWTRLGDHFPTKWLDQKTAVIAENFAGIIPDGVLVRISSVASGDGRPLFDEFAGDLYQAVGRRMREVLVGSVLAGSVPGGAGLPKTGGEK